MFTQKTLAAYVVAIGCIVSYLFCTCTAFAQAAATPVYQSPTLLVTPLTPGTYVHVSYLKTQSFGKVECNGMIVVNRNEAIVFDTPADDSTSYALIEFVEKQLKCKIKAVVINHFHADCLGGLKAFHARNIPSYANKLTLELAKRETDVLPQNGFENSLTLKVGKRKVINQFFGEAHTRDNIVSYFPSEKVLFGGCMVKALNAGKGNLADANTAEWSATVSKVQASYPQIQYVIPGHGQPGNQKLLEYTIQMFK
jgi:metallo-beta-lactamase class B